MLDGFTGVVYDLDNTLLELDVDWDVVREDAVACYEAAGIDPRGRDLWALLEDATDHGIRDDVESVIASHERSGATSSRRLRLADALADETRPVGVCTLNCEAAARTALDVHDLSDAVDVVVGRDTVSNHKPHPEPLLATIEGLDLTPEGVVFVGDSVRDADTAARAGAAFQYAKTVALD